MPIRSAVADWTRHHPVVSALGRVVFGGTGETTRTARSLAVDEVQDSAAPAVERPESLGTTGGLAHTLILTALRRQAYTGPIHRERARANADCLLETIRVVSIL